MMRFWLLGALFVVTGCENGDADDAAATGPDGGAGTPDASPADPDDPPRIRQVHASLEGEFVVEFDLTAEDASYVLPVSERATFAVVAMDDLTPTERLKVAVVNARSGDPAEGQEASLRNGLWRVSLQVEAGQFLGVEVSDESGNAARSPHQLVLTPLIEAIAAEWETPFYDAETREVTHLWNARFDGDGTWYEEHSTTGERLSGTYESEADQLRLLATESSGGDAPDGDPETVEWARLGDFYVDEIYFSTEAWKPVGDTDALVGTWERSHRLYEGANDGLLLAVEVNERLVFDGAGAFALEQTEIDHRSGAVIEQRRAEEGLYEVQRNPGYMGNYGDFLLRTTITVDDLDLQSPQTSVELHTFRAGQLLISPRIRIALNDGDGDNP